MTDPTTPEGRAELRQLLEDGKRDHWEVCTDGRTIGEDAGDDMAKWIGEAGPCAADLIVAAVNALPALLDALERAEAAIERVQALCMSTDGDWINSDFIGNTVGDIRRALDGDQ